MYPLRVFKVKAPQEYDNQGCGQKLPAGSFGPDFNKNQGWTPMQSVSIVLCCLVAKHRKSVETKSPAVHNGSAITRVLHNCCSLTSLW